MYDGGYIKQSYSKMGFITVGIINNDYHWIIIVIWNMNNNVQSETIETGVSKEVIWRIYPNLFAFKEQMRILTIL